MKNCRLHDMAVATVIVILVELTTASFDFPVDCLAIGLGQGNLDYASLGGR